MDFDKQVKLASSELTIEVSTFCGAHCIICPREQYSHKFAHMDHELFCSVVDQAHELGMESLVFGGFGDALLDPGLEKKLKYVKNAYPEVRLYCSATGHRLARQIIPLICQYFHTFKISHYGFTKESFEKVHRGLNFEECVGNINALLSIPREQRPYVIMSFVVVPENKNEADLWREHWEGKCEEVMIWHAHNYGGGYDSSKDEFCRSGKVAARSCGRPAKGNLFVRENGEVSMCCLDFDRKLIIGDLRKETLKDVLTGQPLSYLKKVHKENSYETSGTMCKDCDQIYPREEALIYASNKVRKVGVTTTHANLVKDILSGTD